MMGTGQKRILSSSFKRTVKMRSHNHPQPQPQLQPNQQKTSYEEFVETRELVGEDHRLTSAGFEGGNRNGNGTRVGMEFSTEYLHK